jgi:type IX secretion system PorP/SprF family membrane protein
MSILKRIFILVLFLSLGNVVYAQYFQYSQYNFTQQRINPAMIGLSRFAAVSLDYRYQKNGSDTPVKSNFISFDYPLLNSSTGKPWSGLGVTLHNDKSAGIFEMQEAAISYAIHIQLSKWQTLSLGAKALLQTRSISLDGFYTGSQYVVDRGFDPSYASGESFTQLRTTFQTFSTGVHWQETDRKGRLLHHIGFSFFDLNRPQDSFFGDPSQLSSTFVFNGGFQAYSANDIHIFPEALLTYSASNVVLNTGIRLQKELNPKSRQLSDRVEVIAKYVVGRSGILGVQLHSETVSLGLSYDFPLIQKNVGNLGAVEIGLAWRKPLRTRSQKITAKRKKAEQEKQQSLARKPQQIKVVPKEVNQVLEKAKQDSVIQAIPSVEKQMEVKVKEVPPSTMATAGAMKQEPLIIEKVTLHFPFEFNSAELDDPTEKFLEELTASLKENENLKLKIEGHTDDIGSDKFNLKLSQKRADAVKHHLIKSGIHPDRLRSKGKGMHEPLNSNLTDEDRTKNRRVELTIYY